MLKTRSIKTVFFAGMPIVAMCLSVPLWNTAEPFVIGLPFNLFWLMLWTLLTPLCLWQIYKEERGTEGEHDE